MPELIRVEVTDRYGTVAEILDLDTIRKLPPRKRAMLDALAAKLVDGIRAISELTYHARGAAISEVMRQLADEAAYERVAERRGLLPL